MAAWERRILKFFLDVRVISVLAQMGLIALVIFVAPPSERELIS